nr:ruBisCO large subunit-binding protein subunit beta, chloroplastic [Ipomoea batatas]
MVSELAGEGAMPPQLPTPASRSLETAQPLVHLRQSIRSGSSLRRGVTTLKTSFELWRNFDAIARMLKRRNGPSAAVGGGCGFKASKQDRPFNSSRVLINHPFKAFNCSSRSRFVKNSRLVNPLFAGFNQSSRSRFTKRTSAELVDPSQVAVPGAYPWKARAHCSLILNDSWSRVIVAVSSPQRRTREMIAVLIHPSSIAIPGVDPMVWKQFRGAVDEIDPLPPSPQPNSTMKKHLRSKLPRRISDERADSKAFSDDDESSAVVSRSQSVNFDVVFSTKPSNDCFNSSCKEDSEWPRKGCRRRTDEFANLCDRCASAYRESKMVVTTRGIEKTTKVLVSELKNMSKEVEDSELADVAAVSAGNNYEVGNMIVEAMSNDGMKGVVTLEEGESFENSLRIVGGMQFDRGYISSYFVTDGEKMTDEKNWWGAFPHCLLVICGVMDYLPVEVIVNSLSHLGPAT